MSLPGSAKRIRFGVMCQGTTMKEWQARCLERLAETDGVELSLIITEEAPWLQKISRRISKFRLKHLLFYFYQLLLETAKSHRRRDLSRPLAGVPVIRCQTMRRGPFSEYFQDPDLRRIREYRLDFILLFGFGIIRGGILSAARYGVWSFHHGDESKYRGGPPCFWEIYHGDSVTASVLHRLTERLDAGVVLRKGHFRTVSYSYRKNLDQAFFESARWPAQVCIDILNGHGEYLDNLPSDTHAPIYHNPTNGQTLLFVSKLFYNLFKFVFEKVFMTYRWNVGVVDQPVAAFLKSESWPETNWFPVSKGKFAADPFGLIRGENRYILFEDFDYRMDKAVISCRQMLGSGGFSDSTTVIDELPVHLAYPYVFEWEGEAYCAPESRQAREIRLYRAQGNPKVWKRVATLVENFSGVDPTIFRYENRWWLFCTNVEHDSNTFLYVWYSDCLFGPWKFHPSNPVKADIRSARPAGAPFSFEGHLYRPAQDSSKTYGGRIAINRILRLSPTEFEEEIIRVVEPDRGSGFGEGLHTLSTFGERTLVDGKSKIPNDLPSLLRLPGKAWRHWNENRRGRTI